MGMVLLFVAIPIGILLRIIKKDVMSLKQNCTHIYLLFKIKLIIINLFLIHRYI